MKPFLAAFLVAMLGVPAGASADTVVADPDARQVTALGGTLVWVSGEGPGQKLMQRSPDGTVAPVAGSEGAAYFRSPDLGRDAAGRLVLTYARCAVTPGKCRYVRDDLAGKRTRLRGLALRRCRVSSLPSIWGKRIAYGLSCVKRTPGLVADPARSGLYVKRGSRAPKRLSTPRNARRAGARWVEDVDLRGRRVAALYTDISGYAVIQSTSGADRHSSRAATTEGDGEQSVAGVIVGTGDARLWYLTRSSHVDSAPQSIINRRKRDCSDYQVLTGSDEPDANFDFPYADLAVDAGTLYAVDPGEGIVTHSYQPQFGCTG